MTNKTPNVDADALEGLVQDALYETFKDEATVYEILAPLNKAGVFDALEDYVRSEIENPSLKGPANG
jgi:hypothetical protein